MFLLFSPYIVRVNNSAQNLAVLYYCTLILKFDKNQIRMRLLDGYSWIKNKKHHALSRYNSLIFLTAIRNRVCIGI